MSSDDSQHAAPPVRLGAYAARSCAVRAQWDVVGPCEPEPDTPFRAGLARDGIAFEADVVAELVAREPDAVVIDPQLPTAEREVRTLAALAAGARLIVGPRLPHDPESGRVGAPDLLVRRDSAGATGAPGYAPVDIKNHRTDEDGSYDSARGDLLQLAHYHRMLETLGHAATAATAASQAAPATGAIIGNDRRELWFDLAAPRFTGFSALDLYDTEYAERVRVARAAAAHVADPFLPLARTPVWFGECSGCPWRTHCGALLAERLDVSLLPGVGLADHEALARVGADTMPALAALPDGTRVDGISDGGLVDAIAQARTRLSPDVAHRRPGVAHVTVERADIELDVDMENVADGAYLWGVHVTDRTGAATGTGAGGAAGAGLATPGYHAFVDWDADAGVAGARVRRVLGVALGAPCRLRRTWPDAPRLLLARGGGERVAPPRCRGDRRRRGRRRTLHRLRAVGGPAEGVPPAGHHRVRQRAEGRRAAARLRLGGRGSERRVVDAAVA